MGDQNYEGDFTGGKFFSSSSVGIDQKGIVQRLSVSQFTSGVSMKTLSDTKGAKETAKRHSLIMKKLDAKHGVSRTAGRDGKFGLSGGCESGVDTTIAEEERENRWQ